MKTGARFHSETRLWTGTLRWKRGKNCSFYPFSHQSLFAQKAKILHRRNPYRNLWGSKSWTHEFRSGLSSVLRRFVNTFCSHFLKSESDALSCRTAMFRSELESPDPCAFNDRWNVEFRPWSFQMRQDQKFRVHFESEFCCGCEWALQQFVSESR